MEKCPECNGMKGYLFQITEHWQDPSGYKWRKCLTCEGKGKISRLALAIYKARGGPEPQVFPKNFA